MEMTLLAKISQRIFLGLDVGLYRVIIMFCRCFVHLACFAEMIHGT